MSAKKSVLLVLGVLVGLGVILSGCGLEANPAKASPVRPETVVERFYTLDRSTWLAERGYRSNEYLTPEFVEKVDALLDSFDKGGYDPFLCAQDIPEEIAVGEAEVSGEQARVVVHKLWNVGTEYESVYDHTVELRLVEGQWKIDDIICGQ
jgi:hypothetical protein